MSQSHEFFCITCHRVADLGASNSIRPMSMAHTLEEFNADNINSQAHSNTLLKAMLIEHDGHDYRIATEGSYYLHHVIDNLHELMEDDYRIPTLIDAAAEWRCQNVDRTNA